MYARGFWLIPISWLASFSVACGGTPDVATNNGESGAGGQMVSSGGGGGGAGGAGGASAGTGPVVGVEGGKAGAAGSTTGGRSSLGGAGGSAPTPTCATQDCERGEHCEETASEPRCVKSTCADLDCKATEECQSLSSGGAICKSIACDADVDCPESRYCSGGKCIDDVCEADTRTCNKKGVSVCASNGGSNEEAYVCGGPAYFESVCSDTAGSSAHAIGCTCEGDWDCPEYTACEAGVCKGTGVAPTCTLPPARFKDVLPRQEFRWGGQNAANPAAAGKSFPWSAQVASTPLVVNLDDDNQDGLINELDFPEILFMTYHNAPEQDGVVRAIHGGGPHKGEDYFALCGDRWWSEGQPILTDCNVRDTNAESRTSALARGAGMLAAGDLDGDGVPEIVVPLEAGGVQILDNRGVILATSKLGLWPNIGAANDTDRDWRYPAPAIANLDFKGLAEIVVGNRVLTLKKDNTGLLGFDKLYTGQFNTGTVHNGNDEQHHGPSVCLADLVDAEGLEIVAGTSVYRLPDKADCDAEPDSDYCHNRLTSVWNGADVNPTKQFYPEGFCAVADVLGASASNAPGPDNPPDKVPEVIVVADGNLLIFESKTGKLLRMLPLGGGTQGGAPNVDDFDGDGFPEIAVALSDFYTVVDLQAPHPSNCPIWSAVLKQGTEPPGTNTPRNPGGTCTEDKQCNDGAVCNQRAGQCVCLQSGWKRDTEDDSSKVTSSSVFDFNGDGAAEVVYNDECYFRIYDGATGALHLQMPSLSRTIIENPVVADVDNDGNAEIVFVQNNETIQCDDSDDATGKHDALNSWPDGVDDVPLDQLPNGIEVWGDPSDVWVAARRIWNEHGYHVTNVNEGGQLPLHEAESWKEQNGRLYDTYRSQPRNYGVAPDLTLTAIQISSPDVACGKLSEEIEVAVSVKNQGDLRVGPGVEISFGGVWHKPELSAVLENEKGKPISVTLEKSLEPGASTIVTVSYRTGNNGRDDLPAEINAVVDSGDAERECHEDNNRIKGSVAPGDELPDVRLVMGNAAGCSAPEAEVTLVNDGAAPVENVLVRIYAGDPSQGGQIIGETVADGPIAPGDSLELTVKLTELTRDVKLYGSADPLNTIAECNDSNNLDDGPALECEPVIPR